MRHGFTFRNLKTNDISVVEISLEEYTTHVAIKNPRRAMEIELKNHRSYLALEDKMRELGWVRFPESQSRKDWN